MTFHVCLLGASSLVAGWFLSRWHYRFKLLSRNALREHYRAMWPSIIIGFLALAVAGFELGGLLVQ